MVAMVLPTGSIEPAPAALVKRSCCTSPRPAGRLPQPSESWIVDLWCCANLWVSVAAVVVVSLGFIGSFTLEAKMNVKTSIDCAVHGAGALLAEVWLTLL